MQRTSIPLALAFGPQGCMDEVKGRVVAACCLDDTVPLFEGVKGFVYIKTLRKERGAACSRDVHRDVETHRCKHGRHPARSSYTFHEAVPILPWLWAMYEKTALAAASPVRLWHRAGAARPVLGVSGGLS